MSKIPDGPALFYSMDDILYPVALDSEQHQTLTFLLQVLSPLKVVKDQPMGKAINLLEAKRNGGAT